MNQQELKRIFVQANEFKEGDLFAGGTRDDYERREARERLSAIRVDEITKTPLIEDGISDALTRSLNKERAAEISHLTLQELKGVLLSGNRAAWVARHRDGLASEVIAAAVKLMTNDEL